MILVELIFELAGVLVEIFAIKRVWPANRFGLV